MIELKLIMQIDSATILICGVSNRKTAPGRIEPFNLV